MNAIDGFVQTESNPEILRGSDPIGGVESGGVERQCRSERVLGAPPRKQGAAPRKLGAEPPLNNIRIKNQQQQ